MSVWSLEYKFRAGGTVLVLGSVLNSWHWVSLRARIYWVFLWWMKKRRNELQNQDLPSFKDFHWCFPHVFLLKEDHEMRVMYTCRKVTGFHPKLCPFHPRWQHDFLGDCSSPVAQGSAWCAERAVSTPTGAIPGVMKRHHLSQTYASFYDEKGETASCRCGRWQRCCGRSWTPPQRHL